MCISYDNSNHNSLGFYALARNLMNDKVLVVANKNITSTPHIHGEDYYVYTLFAKLKESGVSVDIAVYSNNYIELYEQNTTKKVQSIEDIIGGYRTILLHNISALKLIRAKFKYKLKLIMPVTFLWNKDWAPTSNIKGFVGNTLWQIAVSQYIATSPSIYDGLKLQGVLRKVYLIPPVYRCKYCDFLENAQKLEKLMKCLPQKVKAVYIGSLNPKRLPLINVMNKLNYDKQRTYELNIYTSVPTRKRTCRIGNTKVNVFNKILSDEQKCRILQASHVFIAPAKGTTMDPPMSVIEAEWHGNLIVRL